MNNITHNTINAQPQGSRLTSPAEGNQATGVILDSINNIDDFRRLPLSDLTQLSVELRHYIIQTLSKHPGHLASSLGTVELTLALHYVFNTPDDKLIWDVGHQAYAHKIITGRRDLFPTIRTYGGLSGFPRMDESPFDAFGTGHSSTSISAALGMATASTLQGNTRRQHIAVIGDGSMTGGEAFEALNNAGVSKANILVVLNDNGISIDKAVGGLSRHLTRITASPKYNRLKEKVWQRLGGDHADPSSRHGKSLNFFQRATRMAKTAALGAPNLFESLGFRYFGPIDGHNIEELVEVLAQLKAIKGPKLLHVVTKKGKGLRNAEKHPIAYHAPGPFNAETGAQIKKHDGGKPLKYQDVFGHTIVELAKRNPHIVGITPAMPTGCSLNFMMEQMPSRAFDVGIAEQHAVTFAAGLAAQGMQPFCNIYSSFMQRAYDQIIHDVALQRLPVIMCLDRAGLVGDDGPTHHGAFDLACLRPIPNLTICAPMDEHELRNMMYTAQLPGQGAVVIRYPRGLSVHPDWRNDFEPLTVGRGRCLQEGTDVAILAIGHVGNDALEAATILQGEGISAAMYDMRYLKPLDTAILDSILSRGFRRVVTVEDGVKKGGLGSAVLEYFATVKSSNPSVALPSVTVLGLPDHFVTHGSVPQLHKDCGIDLDSIIAAARG
ncbi:MAG: 1-deoxy-D-xylulose-5-phosphate synthase [Bacteroidales bacterium]|nr:1-deoxy-D-xylulose-5-phosphate synthase [Bacteroidales bacterium]